MLPWIVLPTYNEAENLALLVGELQRIVEANFVIVDDHSPDGTGAIADQLAEHNQRMVVLHRSGKLGLGSAYQEGFRLALTHRATIVVQMDADGSHDPKLLPALLHQAESHDMVIASRYIRGGSFPIVWYRRWISMVGNYYIRLLLGWSIRDWSTGYKVWQGGFLQRVMTVPSNGVGYAWLMEMTWITRKLQGRIIEVPMRFQERRSGQSKFSWRIATEDILVAWKLFWRRSNL